MCVRAYISGKNKQWVIYWTTFAISDLVSWCSVVASKHAALREIQDEDCLCVCSRCTVWGCIDDGDDANFS